MDTDTDSYRLLALDGLNTQGRWQWWDGLYVAYEGRFPFS